MRKITTLVAIAFLVCNVIFAQNTIAKLKYEEAEEAYASSNFELTISKIREVEGLLKTTNPKLLYLKIKAQAKIIEQNPLSDYAIIESTRTFATKYLKDYDNLPDNEDKYRDIYKISEKLKSYPVTRLAFDEQKKQIEILKDEIDKQKKYDEAFRNFVYFRYYTVGSTLAQAKKDYPDFFKKYETIKLPSESEKMYYINIDQFFLYEKKGKLYGYSGEAFKTRDEKADFSNGNNEVANLVEKFIKLFNFKPVIETKDGINGYTFYTWSKNNKIFKLSHLRHSNNGNYSSSGLISSFDYYLFE